jgi:hypothetical protein
MNPVVEVRDLRRVYPMGDESVVALAGVDLTIEAGDRCSLSLPSVSDL